jgi:N-acyl-L-homoserine lactone synthetase
MRPAPSGLQGAEVIRASNGGDMIVVIQQYNAHEHSDLLDEMFRLRARVFRDRLRWDVQVVDGKERDKYDDERPVYLVYADDASRKVKGSLRLLPTTGPTVLADIFQDTVPDAVHLSSPTTWECTRFCLEDHGASFGQREELLVASTALIAALGEVAIAAGIESIVGNFDSTMLRVYRRIGCEVEVLGSTRRYGRTVYLGLFPVSEAIVRNVKARLRKGPSTMSRSTDRGALVAAG